VAVALLRLSGELFSVSEEEVRVSAEKYRLTCEKVFTWRRVSSSFDPVRKVIVDETSGGDLTLALLLFRLMGTQRTATAEIAKYGARVLIGRFRTWWRRRWRLVVQHSQAGPYAVLVHLLPDFLSERLKQLQHGQLYAKHARPQSTAADSRRHG